MEENIPFVNIGYYNLHTTPLASITSINIKLDMCNEPDHAESNQKPGSNSSSFYWLEGCLWLHGIPAQLGE